MSLLSKSSYKLDLEWLNKLYFTNVKSFVSKKSDNSFLKSLLFGITLLLFFLICEDKSINKEIERLQSLEKELNKTISQNNIEHAKLICIQMKWEYVATTAGAD